MKRVLSLLLVASSIFPIKNDVTTRIKKGSFFAPSNLGSLDLFHDAKGFFVNKANEQHRIEKHFTDSIIRDVNTNQLNSFLNNGYLTLNKMSTGHYSLKAKGRIPGGGPLFGAFMYWVTKSVCYGTLSAAIITSVTVAGGGGNSRAKDAAKDVVILGTEKALLNAAATATVPLSTMSLEGATTLATNAPRIVSTAAMGAPTTGIALTTIAIKGADLGKEAGLVTAAGMVASGGTKLGVAGAIELLSLKVGLFFGMTPTP
jgi:hypothetical protein